jgi:hypothetical protein
MRYSYEHEVVLGDITPGSGDIWRGEPGHPYVGRYVTVQGTPSFLKTPAYDHRGWLMLLRSPSSPGGVLAFIRSSSPSFRPNRPTLLSGRLVVAHTVTVVPRSFLALDTTASRFHGATIAGLVVGAMGVFVFTVALRHWLGERRRFREEARA